jgi:anaerobic dimethyl sulfoxide reductase subunit C (anchor subunit)
MKEGPLVAFTVLAQMAVGAFLTLGALELWGGLFSADPATQALGNGILVAIGAVTAVALAASLLHLGSPAVAWRTIGNLRGSWLSREVALAVAFAACGAAFAALRGMERGGPGLRAVLAGATALSGVALVYAMSRIYRVRTVPAWNSPLTTASFFATTLLLGALGVGAGLALAPGLPASLLAAPLRGIAGAAAVGFTVAGLAATLAARGRGVLDRTRRVLLLVGLALVAAPLLGAGHAPAMLVAAFAVALAVETLGRYKFYLDGLRRPL